MARIQKKKTQNKRKNNKGKKCNKGNKGKKNQRNPSEKTKEQQELNAANEASNEQYKEMVEKLTGIGTKMWKELKQLVKDNPAFMEWSDKKKLSHFRDELKYDEFMNEYPVMTRYMVCMGQYSTKAFKRFLAKVRSIRHPVNCEKGYKEDQWVRRQADYVQYLWEAYQKGHYNTTERNYIWQDAYKNLKGEFDDFRDKYKEIEESTKKEKEKIKASNARDLLERLAGGEQSIEEDEAKQLIFTLTNKLYKHRFNKAMKELVSDATYVDPVCEDIGQGPEEVDEKNQPKIVMTEHVAEDRMADIPEEYVIDPNGDEYVDMPDLV